MKLLEHRIVRDGIHYFNSRRRAATASGTVSFTQAPMADSDPARYLSLPGARKIENS